jgi:quercetin dioxygenase-like cupin family protein
MKNDWVYNLNDKSAGLPRKLAEGIDTMIFFGEQVMISVVEFEPFAKGKLHSHPEEQWGLLLKGTCRRLQGDEDVEMKVGNLWHTPGGVFHTIHAGKNGATVLDIFSPIRKEYTQSGEGFGDSSKK